MNRSFLAAFMICGAVGLSCVCLPRLASPYDDYIGEELGLITTVTTSQPDIFYFLTQPVDVTVNVGETATFSCLASTTNCTYRWQVYTPSTGQWNDSNINSSVYAPDLSFEATKFRNGYMFRCMVTHGTTNERIYSNTCVLTVVEPDSKSVLPISDPIFDDEMMGFLKSDIENETSFVENESEVTTYEENT